MEDDHLRHLFENHIYVIYNVLCRNPQERETAYHTQSNDYKPESNFLKYMYMYK